MLPLLKAVLLCLLYGLLLQPWPGLSQVPEMKFRHIKNEQGLSNSTIECIYQDHRGFMWFGTRDGLNRYDGAQMLVYKYSTTDSSSISDSYITYIYEDRNNILWIGTINGLNKYNPTTNNFTRYKSSPTGITNNYITSIYEDRKGQLWISTQGGGINLWNGATGRLINSFRMNSPAGSHLLSNTINCVFEDSRNNFWVGTNLGLQLFDRDNKQFSTIALAAGTNYNIRTIREDRTGNLLLGTNDNGLFIYNYSLQTFKQYAHTATKANSLSSNLIRSILVTQKGTIWTGTINGGLDLFDPVSEKFFNYQNEPDDPLSLSQRTVSALFEDNQENIWIGTHRGGINLYTPKTEKFSLYRQEPVENSLSYNDVKAFCEDNNGNIWIGTDGGGLNLFDRKTKSFRHYKYNPFDKTTIGSNEVLDIEEDSQGNLWIGTWGGGLCLYNSQKDNFTRYARQNGNNNSISSNYIQKIFEDSKKNLWVATYYGGLNLFDAKTGRFTRVIADEKNSSQLLGNNVVSLNEDLSGNLWIGTDDGGLNCLDNSTHTFRHYFNKDEKKPDLRIIFVDSKGKVWLGQAGLYLFNEQENAFKLYTDKAGLADEFIKGIAEDNAGNLWISTSNGITRFNPSTYSFRKYNTADGLQGLEFEANSFLETNDGQLFFGGVNGFNTFYPRDITTNTFVPPVFVTDFLVQNRHVVPAEKGSPLKKDISLTNKIRLSYKQSTFTFGFAALNYTAAENNQYAYRLENWDKDWIYPANEKRATYTNVSPGRYVFHVKASNNDGVWNDEGYTITVIIQPPFWATWWFRSLAAAVIIAAIIIFYRFKRKLEIRRIEEQKREEMHKVQLQFFTNISHEIRTPLSLILGPIEKLQKDDPKSPATHSYQVIHKNATRLLHLVNELMDFRKSESGVLKLHVMPGNIDSFLEEISEEFSELVQQKNIRFHCKSNHTYPEPWFDRQVLEKIMINLISNSFKYTPDGGSITVETLDNLQHFTPSFENELVIENEFSGGHYIYFRVADNGIGISKDSIGHLFERYYRIADNHLGSGIGLAFVKSLTLLHKGNIHVYSERQKGTEIIVGIPCTKSDYTNEERLVNNNGVRIESIQPYHEQILQLQENGSIPVDQRSSKSNGPNILIVEDNAELRQFLKESLPADYQFSEAANGKEGFEKAKEELPDLVISDIMMPVMDGMELCRLIKNDIDTSHIPFMMLTAKDNLQSKIEGTETGADYYFSKPLSIELLNLTIRNIFTQKQKLKERYVNDYHAEVKELAHSSRDKQFLEELIAKVEANLSNPDMDIDYICTQMGMSRTRLYNKIKNLTGQAIGDFIRTIRLKKAAQLLTQEDMSMTDVMYHVGIQTQSYFARAFKNEFGKTPTQFLKDLNK